MILGIYYLSQPPYQTDRVEGYFVNTSEIEHALEIGQIKVHSRIVSRFATVDEKGNLKYEKHISTAGRFLLANLIPKNIKTVTKTLSTHKKVIVSGLAKGIDTVAHEETLRQQGNTIAVVVDVLNIYPAANRKLAEDIVNSGGLIISENPPSTRMSQGLLVQRDRI